MRGEVNTDHKWIQLPDEVVARYNAYDCLATARAARAIKARLKRNQQWDYFERELWPLLPAVLAMQKRGLPYDSKRKGTYRKRLRKELGQCDARLRKLYAETADYSAELAEVARIEALVANPPEGKPGQKYRTRRTKGITLTKGERDKLGRRLPETWNPNSDQQVARWLFDDLGLRPSTKTEGGRNSVDMDALGRIYRDLRKMDEHARPVLWDLMHRARLNKIDNDYLDPEVRYENGERRGVPKTLDSRGPRRNGIHAQYSNDGLVEAEGGEEVQLLHAPRPTQEDSRGTVSICRNVGGGDRVLRTGRVYPTIKMTGTESGRFAYADPPVHSWPDEIRHIVCTDQTWLGADYSQIEARVFAILTNDTKDLEVYRRFDENPEDKEWDIHLRTAAELFGDTVSGILSRPETQLKGMRVYSKNFRYGVLLYGGGPTSTKAKVGCPCPRCEHKATPTVSITPKERQQHADRWFNQHQCAIRWRETISQQVMRYHALSGPLGQKWYFTQPWGAHVQREAWNRIIQGTAASIIHRAMRALHEWGQRFVEGCPLCLQHHDALYAEVPKPHTDYWATTMRDIMERPVPELASHRFPVALEAGPSWGEMEHWKD